MQYPSLTRSTVRHVELVPLAPTRLLLVLIADTGRVEQRRRSTCRRRSAEDLRRRAAGAAQRRASPAAGWPTSPRRLERPAGEAFEPADRAARRRGRRDAARDARRASARSAWCSAGTANLAALRHRLRRQHRARCSRRSRSRSCCCGCSARRPTDPTRTSTVRIGHENPVRGPASRPRSSPPATARAARPVAGLGVARPDPDGLPRRRWRRCAPSRATSAEILATQ